MILLSSSNFTFFPSLFILLLAAFCALHFREAAVAEVTSDFISGKLKRPSSIQFYFLFSSIQLCSLFPLGNSVFSLKFSLPLLLFIQHPFLVWVSICFSLPGFYYPWRWCLSLSCLETFHFSVLGCVQSLFLFFCYTPSVYITELTTL